MKEFSYLKILSAALCLLMTLFASAQNTPKISGTVLNGKGEPVGGATVTNLTSGKATLSNDEGKFTIVAAIGSKLEITSVGYKPYTVTLNDAAPLHLAMEAAGNNLGEVVVVGYGTQRKANITGSIATVSKEFLADRPLTNASQALQGASGVYVNQASGGQPGGDDATIRIRGTGTLNNNDPLILVDGIAYNLHDINPNDIESISVLKDAASAAIYGNRAANGVVLIKTKTGVRGKTTINYDNAFGAQQVTYLPDMVTNSAQYTQLYNQALVNVGTVLNPGVNSWSPAQIDSFQTNVGKHSDMYPSTNWFDIMFRKAFIEQHNLRFSGGGDKSVYSVSLGYMDQDGVLIGTNAKKYSLASNLAFDLTPHLKAGINLNGVYWTSSYSPATTSGMFNTIYRMVPFWNAKLANGNFADNPFPTGLLNAQNSFRNPYAMATTGLGQTNSSDILANVFAEYSLPFHLKYKINYGVTKADLYDSRFIPNTLLYNPSTGAANPLDWGGIAPGQPKSAERLDTSSINTTFFQTLTWNGIIGAKHNIGALVGTSAESYTTTTSDAYGEGIIDNNVTELSNTTINQRISSSTAVNKLASYFGRVNYNFDERYLAEFDFRYDGSSRFAAGNRWGFFPSASAGWRIDQEKFFSSLKNSVNSLKVRGSWGQLGNQNSANFAYLPTYTNTTSQGYTFGGTNVVGAAATSLSNPDISWEKTTTTNVGIDAAFFNSKLSVTADYFNRLTTGILTPVVIPAQIGNLTGPTANLYSVRNRGVELSLDYKNSIGKFGYEVGGNISYVDNKVVNLNGQQQISGLNIIKQGYSINAFYLLKATGIFQDAASVAKHAYEGAKTQPGDLIYQPQNGDTAISGNDRIVTGRSIPLYTYSFTLGLTYSHFDLNAFFQGVADVDTYLTLNASQPFYNGAGITRDWATDSWTPTHTNATLPRLTTVNGYTQNFQGIAGSTWWLKNASYLRLKNLQLGYTLPIKSLQKAGISRLRVFANAQNLFTFSPLKITDPERATTLSTLYSYPSVKTFTGGISLTF